MNREWWDAMKPLECHPDKVAAHNVAGATEELQNVPDPIINFLRSNHQQQTTNIGPIQCPSIQLAKQAPTTDKAQPTTNNAGVWFGCSVCGLGSWLARSLQVVGAWLVFICMCLVGVCLVVWPSSQQKQREQNPTLQQQQHQARGMLPTLNVSCVREFVGA